MLSHLKTLSQQLRQKRRAKKRGYTIEVDPGFQLENVTNGTLSVIVAEEQWQVDLARELRYKVFVEEIGGEATEEMQRLGQDFDEFDAVCDHLLVIDTSLDDSENAVVGTYRILRGSVAKSFGKFYTQQEFDISKLVNCGREVMELGRSCVHPDYRSKSTIQLLWKAIAEYMHHYDIAIMFGCASFHGVDVEHHKQQLAYLYHNHLAPDEYMVKALPHNSVDMNCMKPEEADFRAAWNSLPPLVKGYLRLGAYIGDGAMCDYVANTLDVAIILDVEKISDKYAQHYARDRKE